MPDHKSIIAGFIIATVCLLSFPTTAQQSATESKQANVSADGLISLHHQIKELKNPTFRAFLRMRLLSWESPEAGPPRRRAAMEVATLGVRDLCEHQDEVWSPTASWLYGSLVKQIKTLQSPEDTNLQLCVLKTDPKNNPEKELSSGIKMLSNPETTAAGLNLAKSAILSGQVSAHAILGQLLRLNATHSPHLPDVLGAVLLLEENQPGALPLKIMPFFSSIFIEKSIPPEILTRFLFVAVRSTRLSAEDFANPTVRGPVMQLLNGIINPAQRLSPALYPEIAARLSSLNPTALNRTATRLAAEERIQKASDQLEQLIAEANSVSDEGLETHFFFKAARLAKEQGQLSKAVDLAIKAANDNGRSWLDDFLSEIVSLAIKKSSPRDATYAISRMMRPLEKARAFRLLGEYYGSDQDKVEAKEAFTQSAKQLTSVDNSNEKVKSTLLLAESVLQYDPADAFALFHDAIKAINDLRPPEKEQEKMYYVHLLPVAGDLIRSFGALAAHENQTATTLAAEIKLSELRVAALSGVYSAKRSGSGP